MEQTVNIVTQTTNFAAQATNSVFTTSQPHPGFGIPVWFIVLFFVAVAVAGIRGYLKFPWRKVAPLFLLTFAAASGALWYRWSQISELERLGRMDLDDDKSIASMIAAALLPMLAIPFVVKLYLKWTGQNLTAAEKSPGMAGVRAWLGVGNLIVALLIPLCAWWGFDCSFWGILAVTLMALLAYPVINPSSASSKPGEPETDSLAPERERVLKLLDDGKITAQESADLLNALGHATPPRAVRPASAVGPYHGRALLGGVVLLIGFFMPWFRIDLGVAMSQKMGQVQQSMGQSFGMQLPQLNLSTGTTYIAGGDIGHGLGWIILLLGLAAAVLPYVATNLDPQTVRTAALACLGIGAIILLYLLSDAIRYVNGGIFLVLLGYTLEFIGTLKQRPALQR